MDKIGTTVEYVDAVGKTHEALVTADWGGNEPNGSINVVYVSTDPSEHDNYGRQIKRETSVVHQSRQSAHGRFWR